MLHVLDNALTEDERVAVRDYFLGFKDSTKPDWADGAFDKIVVYGSPLSKLLSIAGRFVNLTPMVGCEYWSHLSKKSGWHKDTDETKLYRDGLESFPLCSCVYYPHTKDLVGGSLLFDSFTVRPLTNRLVIFSPDLLHCVEDFSGERISVAVNPWHYKLEGYE
jgi:hypothetical protein